MSGQGLPEGAFVTTIDGRRCTARPRPQASTTSILVQEPPPTTTSIIEAQPTTQVLVGASSQADNNVVASPSDLPLSSQTTAPAAADVSSPPPLPESGAAEGGAFTTIGTAQSSATNNAAAESTDTSSTNSQVSPVPNPNSNAVQSTVAVAGGVIGGVIAISLVAFVVWWWRRRVLRKRRSTLLTPLDAASSFDRDEKGPYIINRGSIGPTPMVVKLKAALGYNVKKFQRRMSHMVTKSNGGAPSVNLDRGNSQFMDPVSTRSRSNSGALDGGDITAKDRFQDWWSRLTDNMKFKWRVRNQANMDDFAIVSGDREKRTKVGSQPDFLTLLGMDDSELDREAQRRRASVSRKNGSVSSTDNFLGGLSLNFGSPSDNPFSDAHASAQPAPLVVSGSNNPFSDTNAIRDPPPTMAKPNTYVADIRRSRGQSVGANTARQPSTLYNSRESTGSVESFNGRRNKFRSDPFDLERPELLAGARAAKNNSIVSSTAGTAGSEPRNSQIRRPPGAHTRSESFTSKYSSGVSMGDWSDPGPDVGPAASKWDGPEQRESPTQGWRDRLEKESAAKNAGVKRMPSDGSTKSVGKAM
ncbi:hypothetical protein QBC37DRAFT_279494 [Rhypophila decipiens]|uniref:Uncharacterized protein n=1 Tax=Rhypophila decipiens TaxID=261697 RepID=A0AAN6YC70_9PEZI|nr:hypothetical protein QBC37DRAFT_279494 [Rhypophila decipiens]